MPDPARSVAPFATVVRPVVWVKAVTCVAPAFIRTVPLLVSIGAVNVSSWPSVRFPLLVVRPAS